MNSKVLLAVSVVIECFILIRCNRANKLSDNSDNIENKSEREFNPKYIEDVNEPTLSTPQDSTTGDYITCYCGSGDERDECTKACRQLEDDRMFLLTASEVVLGTAIIMGLSALVTVVLRICTSRRRSSRTVTDTPGDFDRMGALRISLSSLQQRVMSKLRDRPPRYETRHNYEYQRRETSTRIPVLNPAAVLAAVNEPSIPPPAYETNSDDNSVNELPPTYLIAIEDSGGFLNSAFTLDERISRNESDTSRDRTNDSALHI